jgi:hypothetical protein
MKMETKVVFLIFRLMEKVSCSPFNLMKGKENCSQDTKFFRSKFEGHVRVFFLHWVDGEGKKIGNVLKDVFDVGRRGTLRNCWIFNEWLKV